MSKEKIKNKEGGPTIYFNQMEGEWFLFYFLPFGGDKITSMLFLIWSKEWQRGSTTPQYINLSE